VVRPQEPHQANVGIPGCLPAHRTIILQGLNHKERN
jgi:hypothetical protein